MSGLIWARVTENQTADVAFKALMKWAHGVGIPHECRSDGGGSFRLRCSELLKEVGIKQVLTSAYNSKSDDGCERAIRSLKDCLKRDEVMRIT